jgi:hypothetical protein
MAKTSRNPFAPPPVPMKRRKKVKEAAVVPAAVVPAAAVVPTALGTQKKKKTATTSAKQNLDLLSDIDKESIYSRKPPPEDISSYVPYGKRNTPRSTRTATRQPPTLLYLPSLPPIADNNCNPLNHNSPHKDPPAEFVEEVAHAADPSNATEDHDEEEERFTDLVGGKRSGLNDLSYSSLDDDDEDYDDRMEEEACRIEYSDRNNNRHGPRQTNFIPGGPKPPIYDGMSATEMAFAKSEFRKVRKKYTNGLQIKRLKKNNEEYEPESFSGCLALFLRPMADVQKGRLEVNHTFPNKKILLMRVAEEANLRGVNLFCVRSDLRKYMCIGFRFCVKANHTEQNGWIVSVANVRECDQFCPAALHLFTGSEKLTSPFWTKWIVPLILPIILESPAISNKNLRAALSSYGKEHALTDSILQEARTEAKAQLFGIAEDNVKFTERMKSELEKEGHVVELVCTNRKDTLKKIERLVVREELIRLKNETNGSLDREEGRQFWSKWKTDHYALLVNQLGFKTQDSRFFHSVFFTPSFTKTTVPKLQTLFTADACHLNFGKYTLFACYGVTANANSLRLDLQ